MTPRARNVIPTGYASASGTSDATAIIAGVAALIRAKYPDLSAQDIIHRMITTADDRGTPGRDDYYGYGIINPLAALTADIPPLNPPTTQTHTDNAAPPPSRPADPRPLILAGLAILLIVLLAGGVIVTIRRRL
jgi:Subtilisin-like serine proteases